MMMLFGMDLSTGKTKDMDLSWFIKFSRQVTLIPAAEDKQSEHNVKGAEVKSGKTSG